NFYGLASIKGPTRRNPQGVNWPLFSGWRVIRPERRKPCKCIFVVAGAKGISQQESTAQLKDGPYSRCLWPFPVTPTRPDPAPLALGSGSKVGRPGECIAPNAGAGIKKSALPDIFVQGSKWKSGAGINQTPHEHIPAPRPCCGDRCRSHPLINPFPPDGQASRPQLDQPPGRVH
ncbi:MAG: hypothetical protein QOJ99_4532, partial [Bryobacterales bacterium]|nr:hypothetical protein [Bryobacterales bacterium]